MARKSFTDRLAEKAAEKLGERAMQKAEAGKPGFMTKRAQAQLSGEKKKKIHITYDIENAKEMYQELDEIRGTLYVENTTQKEKRVKNVEIQFAEMYSKKVSKKTGLKGIETKSWASERNILQRYPIEKGVMLQPGEKKEFNFEIQLPDKFYPRSGKNIKDWVLILIFVKSSITSQYMILVEGTDPKYFDAKQRALAMGFQPSEFTGTEAMQSSPTPVSEDESEIDFETTPGPPRAPGGGGTTVALPKVSAPKPAKPEGLGLAAIDKMEEWIREDKMFLKLVDQLVVSGDESIAVKFDLETEGFLEEILVRIVYSDLQEGKTVMKLECRSSMEVPYHANLIIGKTKEGIMACPIDGPLKDDDFLLTQLRKIEANTLPKDTLSNLFYQNRELRRMIGRVIKQDSPDLAHVASIRVPIKIEKKGEGCLISLQTFYDKSIRPYEVFVNVMDGIAEMLDQLLDLKPEERKEVPMAKEEWFSVKKPEIEGKFDSKFIKSERSDISNIPTCPHCDRPLPGAGSTDYRRCPYCYEKL